MSKVLHIIKIKNHSVHYCFLWNIHKPLPFFQQNNNIVISQFSISTLGVTWPKIKPTEFKKTHNQYI